MSSDGYRGWKNNTAIKMAANTEPSFYLEQNVVHTSIPQTILDDLCRYVN